MLPPSVLVLQCKKSKLSSLYKFCCCQHWCEYGDRTEIAAIAAGMLVSRGFTVAQTHGIVKTLPCRRFRRVEKVLELVCISLERAGTCNAPADDRRDAQNVFPPSWEMSSDRQQFEMRLRSNDRHD